MSRIPALCVLVATLAVVTATVSAQERRDTRAPVYQRRSTAWQGGYYNRGWQRDDRYVNRSWQYGEPSHSRRTPTHFEQPTYQRYSGFSFQRPYPYHLDYYRMRYHGSYAPYFGNLYGPPKVYAPTYFGDGGYAPYGDPGYFDPSYGGVPRAYGQPMIVEQSPQSLAAPVEQPTGPAVTDPGPADE